MPNDAREPMWRRYGRFLRSDINADVDEELAFHLEMRTRHYESRGLPPAAAQQAAQARFGDVRRVSRWLRRHDRTQERARHTREIMSSIAQNLRVGLRALRKQPTFTATTLITLALGIGATTAMFSVVYAVLLAPLPFREPERLVRVWTAWKPSIGRGAVSAANWRDWRAQNHAFEDIALIHNNRSFNLSTNGEPERLQGARVSAGFFTVLQVTPLLGRTFTEAENEIGREQVVVLGHELWVRRFGADPSIVGRAIPLNGVPTTVAGVMRKDFRYPSRTIELWVPVTVPADEYTHRSWGSYSAVARLKPGVTLEQARSDMAVISANLARLYAENASMEAGLAPLLDDMVGGVRRPLFVLLGAVAAMLLIGCANLTNLLLARGVVRRRELAVRTALGASRARLVEQSVTELVPLLALGGLLGIAVAAWVVRILRPFLPADLPRTEAIGIQLPVLAFATAIVVVMALLVGILPAMHTARRSVASTIAELSRGATSAPGRARARDLLVIAQIAATLVLLIGATVLMRSFLAVRSVQPGFNPERVLSVGVAIPASRYPTDRDAVAFYSKLLDRVHELPGVTAAGIVNRLPLSGNNQTGGLEIEGADDALRSPNVQTRAVAPDYFRALEIPLREGRTFTASDDATAPIVAIIDERVAKAAWPGKSPIGRRVREGKDGPWGAVVGVVGHVRHTGLDGDSDPQVYWNYPQRPDGRMTLVVKTQTEPAALTRSIAGVVRSIDPQQPIYDARTLSDVVDASLGQRWFQMMLLAVFAVVALALASIGTYGVIAYGVGQRLREFGVRIALGARRRDVVAMVVRRGGALFALGAFAGLVLSTAAVRLLSTLVYGVSPRDTVSFVAATAVLFAVSMIACYVPARRAARVDPSVALRSE
ncbi:MAG TPA: ABC transporter permease [Gemmatimonadaceae bacterium]|nr:ABC transporter permease [Gemmatimonadaceae bacterium]